MLNVVYAQNKTKQYEIVDSFHLEIPYNLLWTPKTSTDAGKIRLAGTKSSPSKVLHDGFINPISKKTISINSTNSLSKSNSDQHVSKPRIKSNIKAIIQTTEQGDIYSKRIYNAEGVLVGNYTMSLSAYEVNSGFPDGRLWRYNINKNAYEILTSNTASPIKITDEFDRPLGMVDKWSGYNSYYNEITGDIFVNTGVLHNGSPSGLVFVVDKNNRVLWQRFMPTKYGYSPHLNYSPTGNIFTLCTQDVGNSGSDLLVINRSGQKILDLQNIRCSIAHQVFSSDDKYLITIVDAIEVLVYDLHTGEIVKTVRGSDGKNFLSVDYAAETRQLFMLKRRLEKDKTFIEMVVLSLDKSDEKFFKGEEIVSFTGYKKPRGKIRVSDDGSNVSVIIENEFYELSEIDD